MLVAWKAVIAVVVLAVLAAGGTALVYGPRTVLALVPGSGAEVKADAGAATGPANARPDVKAEAKAEAKPAAPSAAAKDLTGKDSASKDSASKDVAAALADTEAQAKAALGDLPGAAPPAKAEEHGPSFDVARIDDDGEAVIAGRAAPGARVELLRDGQKYDSVVADASGQFVITPPRLPAGNYKLTLKSTAPDGSVAQSRGEVPVALNAPAASAQVASATAEVPRATKDAAKDASAPQAALALAAPSPDAKEPAKADSKADTTASTASRVVSRGDSLWMISRRIYGDGMSYPLIFKANRDKISNPDRIYPGQTFLLPPKGR